ncbi:MULTISPECIES: hypothetical protein [unclassified Streptomyces]|uniref:hypothetical protein n=1 Tax=unclassified Streptomyces TaxID=2593676 RepID=UPI0033DDDBAA
MSARLDTVAPSRPARATHHARATAHTAGAEATPQATPAATGAIAVAPARTVSPATRAADGPRIKGAAHRPTASAPLPDTPLPGAPRDPARALGAGGAHGCPTVESAPGNGIPVDAPLPLRRQ